MGERSGWTARWTRGRAALRGALPLAVAAALVAALPARAQGPAPVKGPPRLVYSAPPECPSEAAFRHEVAYVIGDDSARDPFDAGAQNVVRVTFTRTARGYRGSVQYTPAGGDPWPARETTGAMCELLFRSVATEASLRIPDPPPKRAPAPVGQEPAPAPHEAATKAPVPVASNQEVPSSPAAPPPRALRFTPRPPPPPQARDAMDLTIAVNAAALVTAGFTANAEAGFQLGVDVRGEMFSLGLEGRYVLPGRVIARDRIPPDQVRHPNADGSTIPVEFDISQLTALLVPCVRFAKIVAGCAVVQSGILIQHTPVETATVTFIGFGPRLMLDVPIGDRFGVFGFAEALFAPDLGGFGFFDPAPGGDRAPNVIWRRSLVSGFFGAGFSVRVQ